MCDRKQYAWLEHKDTRVRRLVDEDKHSYVIVPRESHVKHHLLVVLKSKKGVHKSGLIHCTANELELLSPMISRWCKKLRRCGYDTIYAGCYSDDGHVHFHLIPLQLERDKGYRGEAMQWLGEKERRSDSRPFDRLSDSNKRRRLRQVQSLVKSLQALHGPQRNRSA